MTSPSALLYREIPLTKGQVAIVDASDYEWLTRWSWQAAFSATANTYYAVSCQRVEGKNASFRMHRMILGLEHGDKRQGDHINLDTLDNRRSNLRIASVAQNCQNRGIRSNKVSQFKGVCYEPRGLKHWVARIRLEGRLIHLGLFLTPELAHAAYCEAAKRLHGEFARTA